MSPFRVIALAIALLAPLSAAAQVLYSGVADPNALSNIPSNSIGIDNAWYLDLLTLNIYGPKTLGVWPPTPVRALSTVPDLSALPNVQHGGTIPPAGLPFINSSGFVVIAQ